MATKKKAPAKKPAAKSQETKTYKKKQSGSQVCVTPYILGIIGLFILITFIFDAKALGNWTKSGLNALFGGGMYFVPVYLFVIAFTWKKDKERKVLPLKTTLYSVNALTLLMLIRLMSFNTGVVFNWITDSLVDKVIGAVATWIFTLILFLGSLILLCGSTPHAVIKAIINFFKDVSFSSDDPEDIEEAEEEAPKKKVKKAPQPETHENEDGQRVFELPELEEEQVAPKKEEKREINRSAAWENEDKKQQPVIETVPEPEKAVEQPQAEPQPAPEAEPAAVKQQEKIAEMEAILERTEDIENADEEPEIETETVVENTPPYVFPPLSLLIPGNTGDGGFTQADIRATGQKLIETLESFGARAKIVNTSCGPTVTRFELQPEIGVKVKQIINLSEDIALHLSASSVRVEPIPGKGAVGVEIPNKRTSLVRLHDLVATPEFRDSSNKLLTCLGRDIAGNPVFLDIRKMPHLLIAGATGQGKSVCLNSLIISLLYKARPEEVKLILIDPKKLELSDYNGLPHLLVPVVTEPKKAAGTLNWAVMEMEKRFEQIQDVSARDSHEYNEAVAGDPEKPYMPDVVIVIDELADLMMTAPDDVETSICRLAQKARAAGMHLVIGTQRPSTDVITGLIKANIPSRIAFTVVSRVDSDIILGQSGAERLLGKGDMLYAPVSEIKPLRVQGAFVDGKKEVTAVTQFIKSAASVEYDESVIEKIEQEAKNCGVKKKKITVDDEAGEEDDKDEPLKIKALEVAFEYGTISTTMIQRRLSLGYAKASRIVDKLERSGFIGEFDPVTKKRAIHITPEQLAEMKMNAKAAEEE